MTTVRTETPPSIRKTEINLPDAAVVAIVLGFFILCSIIYFPGFPAGIAESYINNPVFYADRFAFPDLYPNDLSAAYMRNVYPFLTLVFTIPALLLKFLHIPPIYPSFVMIALNDPLIVLAVY